MKKNNMKKLAAAGVMAVAAMMMTAGAYAEEAAVESIQFSAEAQIIPAVGEEFDAAALLEIADGSENTEILYSVYDEAVAEVSEDGVLTATGYGVTTVIAYLAEDETVCTSMDVAVVDFYGTYSGQKFIEAMSCDILVDITLQEDGTYSYYRAPMVIQMEGGGEMPELTEEGTYEVNGAEVTFTGETLGEYTVSFGMNGDMICLEGKIPTGGPSTDMTLEKPAEEAEEETEALETETEN